MYMKALRGHKRPQLNENKNENNLEFDKYDSDGYIPLLFSFH